MPLRVVTGLLMLLAFGLAGCDRGEIPESNHGAIAATATIESIAPRVRDSIVPAAMLGDSTCPWDTDTDGRARAAEERKLESPRLASTAGRITRRGDTLVVRLVGGREERLVDCLFSADRYARYAYLAAGPRDAGFIFEISQYESSNPFWMDDSLGSTIPLASLPEYSPDSTYLAVANEDLMAGYTANVFEVWRVRGRTLERVFRAEGKDDWGASRVRWLAPGSVQFTKSRLVKDEIVADSQPARVVLREGRWQYDLRAP